jgi:putative exosortase-associated protein (TIGR04073 family)
MARTGDHVVRHVCAALVMCVLLSGMTGQAEALQRKKVATRGTAMKKLGRGVTNVVTGPGEIFRDIKFASAKGTKQGLYGLTAVTEGIVMGTVTGTVKSVGRMASGIYDIATFPLDLPSNYGSFYQPDTIFEAGYWTPKHTPTRRR